MRCRFSHFREFQLSQGQSLHLRNGSANPKVLRLGNSEYRRVLDRFYLPTTPESAVSVALFDLCADLYERLIDPDRNRRTIRKLLELACEKLGKKKKLAVLDFGCGSGLSAGVIHELNNVGYNLLLVGTDGSPRMLNLARTRKMDVVQLQDWRTLSPERFDIIISAYVFHYGLTDVDLKILSRQLKSPGVMVANYYKPDEEAVASIARRLRDAGFICHLENGTDITEGVLIVGHK